MVSWVFWNFWSLFNSWQHQAGRHRNTQRLGRECHLCFVLQARKYPQVGKSDQAQKVIIIATGRWGPHSSPHLGEDGEGKLMLCVPALVQFALVEGVVQLWNLEPGHKCWFLCSGDQVWAWELAPRAWLAFCPQVAQCFSSVTVLCGVWTGTHKNSVSCCFTIDFFVLFGSSWRGEGNACEGMVGMGVREENVEAAPFGKMFSVCYTCTFGTGKTHAAAAWAEER